MTTTRRRFCPKGHDTLIVGRGSNRQCRACRRVQQTTESYRAARRRRQSTPTFREGRTRYNLLIRGPKRFALRIAASISALDAKLGGLFIR